jgi:hypothetical protein
MRSTLLEADCQFFKIHTLECSDLNRLGHLNILPVNQRSTTKWYSIYVDYFDMMTSVHWRVFDPDLIQFFTRSHIIVQSLDGPTDAYQAGGALAFLKWEKL